MGHQRRILFVVLFGLLVPAFAGLQPAAAEETPASAVPALPIISWKDAGRFVGKEVYAIGKVVRTAKSRGGHAFLNFDAERKTLTIFIKKEDYKNFPQPPEETYKDKMIKVRGFVYEFNSGLNIAGIAPDRITVMPDDTPLPIAPVPPAASTRPASDGTITLGSYNVLNLFDTFDDPYANDETTPAKPVPQLEALGRNLHQLNADVLALCEVENRGGLQRFADTYLPDMGYEVVLYEGNDVRGIDVALLSRLPVGPVTSYRHLRFPDRSGKLIQFQRDLLRVRLEPKAGMAFEVFVVHLKSKGGSDQGGTDDDPGIEIRVGEARTARGVFDDVLKHNPEARFVLCGDFNDTVDSEPLKTILGTGPTALTSFVSDLPADQRVSYNQPPFLSMIDFILASPAMTRQYVAKSYHIVVGGSPEKSGSDHNAVVARFKMN